MAILIQLKRSAVAADVPDPSQLSDGEVAINTADSKLFHKTPGGSVVELGMAPAERTKLSGVATGATANDTDANLKNRANHTGSQAISTVTNLQTSLDAKAALASPTFTGVPAAPTAAGGTNTTQIATTAFVQTGLSGKLNLTGGTLTGALNAPTAAAGTSTTQVATTAFVAGRAGTKSVFSAHKNGANQTGITAGSYQLLTFGTEAFDVGGNFASSRWTPPAGMVQMNAFAFLTPTGTDIVELSIHKNGTTFASCQRTEGAGSSFNVSVVDQANGTDYYEVFVLFAGATGSCLGTANYTRFTGSTISGA